MISARALVGVDVDVEALAEQLDPRLGDRLANEDALRHAREGSCSKASSAARHRDAALDLGAELGEHELDRRERRS